MTDIEILKRQVLHALKRGTGEAYLIVKEHPKIDFSNQIIQGALHIFAYDGQSEGDRAAYIFEIISISKQKDKIRKAVLQGLAKEQDDTWNLTHLFALAKLYAQQNDVEAKQAIYDRFLNNPIEGSDWVGAYEILELDGLKGLFYVADKFGKYIEQHPDDWQDDGIIQHFQAEHQNIQVAEELQKKARTNKFIRLYLDNIQRTETNLKVQRTKPQKYKDIIDEVLNSKPCISFARMRKLTEEEINTIAKHLLKETDQGNIERLLDIFDFHKFPYDSQLILDYAKHKRTNKNSIAENAINALKHLKSKAIRDFALDKIQTVKNPIDYLELLISNYKSGDSKLLNDIAEKAENEHEIERLAGICTAIFKKNNTKSCKKPLEILYSKMNCALHRKGIIEILLDNNVLSDTIKKELQFDCNLETRMIALHDGTLHPNN
jgi:predicted nucleic acid-binding protein